MEDDHSQRHPRHPRRGERGGSFAELMLATLIVGTTVVGATSSLSETAEVYHFFSDGPHDALMLAQEIHEAAVSLPWEEGADNDFTFGEADTLWELDGMFMSPPTSAQYEQVASHPNWSQYVRVYHVDIENPTQIVDPAAFDGETLVQLRVWVWSPEWTNVEGFTWWISEPEADV